MKARLDCVVCQQRQALRILRLTNTKEERQEQALREILTHLSTAYWDEDPMSLSTEMLRTVSRISGVADPYEALKVQSNTEVLQLYPELQGYLEQSADPLLTASKLAIAGNIMDFGAMDHFNIEETIQHVLKTDFAINDYQRFQTELSRASSLLLFADNAGEIGFDKLLLETILARYPLKKITVVVKEHPIINDATMVDVEQIGLNTLSNIEFMTIDPWTNGNGRPTWLSSNILQQIQDHDVVISKGQANYEIMSEVSGIYFLLIAKCPILADDSGTHEGALILKYRS